MGRTASGDHGRLFSFIFLTRIIGLFVWLICCERKLLLAGCWWLVCSREIVTAGWLLVAGLF
jgi:hypothetical protein